jgi:hypothetical protein
VPRLQSLLVLAVVGAVAGGLIGYLTRPEAAQIKLGPLSLEVQGDKAARGGGPLTDGQTQHVLIAAVIGGVIGAGLGLVMGRARA